MRNLPYSLLATVLAFALAEITAAPGEAQIVVFDADDLEDKIRGGMLAQVIGNLNGLPHEFKYIDEPGNVEEYTPKLPDGARTDDDTDIEWVYLREIARSGKTIVPPPRIAQLWKSHINRRIWCANKYARSLMDLGFEPPWTGSECLNPWAEFNISGQFVCESFGLMSPLMPETAARTGLHYTRVAIDGEPAQTTQLFTTMIAMAFVQQDLDDLLDAGLTAVDPNSRVAEVVREVRKIHAKSPDDWRQTRREIKRLWQTHGGDMRDRNGYELNTASTIAALLHGEKEFVETLRLAFNMGWDCDNNAATAATILGVMRGRRWMNEQGWPIADVYRNTTRDNMPNDETLTGLENTLIESARHAIEERGGERTTRSGRSVYRIRVEDPSNIQPLTTLTEQTADARKHFLPRLDEELRMPGPARARAAYVAICLGEADRLKRESPDTWRAAAEELANYPALIEVLFNSPGSAGERLRHAATSAGISAPPRK
jgi:hypothetical protein